MSHYEKRLICLQRLRNEGIEISSDFKPHSMAMEGIMFTALSILILTVEAVRLSFAGVVIQVSSDLFLAHIICPMN
jgi:hypothetical protein